MADDSLEPETPTTLRALRRTEQLRLSPESRSRSPQACGPAIAGSTGPGFTGLTLIGAAGFSGGHGALTAPAFARFTLGRAAGLRLTHCALDSSRFRRTHRLISPCR